MSTPNQNAATETRAPITRQETTMHLVTLNRHQTPLAVSLGSDPLVREVVAYVARLRAQAAEHRRAADDLDAAADRAEPVPVVAMGLVGLDGRS